MEIRDSLTAEIKAADGLSDLDREALLLAFVPFAELFCRQQALGTPEAGRAVASATLALAAAVVGHLHMNVSRPSVDKPTAIREFLLLVERRVLRALAADGVLPGIGGMH